MTWKSTAEQAHVGGRYIRHTLGHVDCEACEKSKRLAVEIGSLAQLEFSEGANAWLAIHQRYISARTVKDYKQYIRALSKFFARMQIGSIHVGHLREYQTFRKVVPTLINMELSCLQQILKEAKCWESIAPFYKPLPVSSAGSGRSLNSAQAKRLLEIAFSRSKWAVAAHVLQVLLMTGCGFGELQHVTRGDVDLDRMEITISEEGAKNEDRERTIPLNTKAQQSVSYLVGRWQKLGGRYDHEYLLPHHAGKDHKTTDFSRPQYGINRAWNAIRKEWAGKDEKLKKFRIYDCRVTAITRTLSSGKVSIHTAKKLYGQVSEAMQKRYYKPDLQILRDAVNLLENDEPPATPIQRTGKKAVRRSDGLPVQRELSEVPESHAQAHAARAV